MLAVGHDHASTMDCAEPTGLPPVDASDDAPAHEGARAGSAACGILLAVLLSAPVWLAVAFAVRLLVVSVP